MLDYAFGFRALPLSYGAQCKPVRTGGIRTRDLVISIENRTHATSPSLWCRTGPRYFSARTDGGFEPPGRDPERPAFNHR